MTTRTRSDRARVLLLWPGGVFEGGRNFGVPQLLSIAQYLERHADVVVDIIDLDFEKALGEAQLLRRLQAHYDIVGISCYSSFDYLKVLGLATWLRTLQPGAWFVVGGYHPSARPNDFLVEGSAFDYVVVGDGELPLARLCDGLIAGKKPLNRVLGPQSLKSLAEVLPYDWSKLERYRPIARQVASQAEIYLSRGCPFDCSFCMERAKRDTSWRPVEIGQAVEELHRLDAFLDLSTWTLFIADALFGMKPTWRKQFLEELARRPIRVRKVWLLIRIDLLDREDLELMARANIGFGVGLESGDPGQLARIRKSGKLDSYLDKMLSVADWAREFNVPFGANIIVGHPGETEASLRTSAGYMERLFLNPKGTTGFLSVDHFRLYPGSPIDEDLPGWEERTGMHAHRYPWWHDGDQDFLGEWVAPSSELPYRRTRELSQQLFEPILKGIQQNFRYTGPALDYFQRAIDEQLENLVPERQLRTLALSHLWTGLLEGSSEKLVRTRVAQDERLATLAKSARAATIRTLFANVPARIIAALLEVPRERFVSPEYVEQSAKDIALPLREDHLATISAMHAYVGAFVALGLEEGDSLVELGGGSGYGAALAASIVGKDGRVTSIECDTELAAWARDILANSPQITFLVGDAHEVAHWRGAKKVYCAFSVSEVPDAWLRALAPGGKLVVPVGTQDGQTQFCITRTQQGYTWVRLGEVRYVGDRSAQIGAKRAINDSTSAESGTVSSD